MSDTPIYDQMMREAENANTSDAHALRTQFAVMSA